MAKKLIKEIRPYVKLYRDTNNGIAWIEDGSTGLGISVHPNLDKSGSVTGMKKLGYWDKSDRIVLSHGWKYNIDRFVCDKKNDLDGNILFFIRISLSLQQMPPAKNI